MAGRLNKEILGIMKEQNEYLIPMHAGTNKRAIHAMAAPFRNAHVTKVAAIETKGLLFGPLIASYLNVPFIPVLKRSKTVPKGTVFATYSDYAGRRWRIRLFRASVTPGDRILLVDDWFDSGNTAKAAISLIQRLGGRIAGISSIVNQLKPNDELFFSQFGFRYLVRLSPKKPGQKGRWKP
jgi:adenine phosphoribosyltransferase